MASETTKSFGRAMWVVALIMETAKRLGLARLVVRVAFRRFQSRKIKRSFAGYSPDEHDVIVATFAKSGTNWMMQIAQQIAWRGAAEFEHIHDVVPWPDSPAPLPCLLGDTAVRDASPTHLRVIKTHLEAQYVPYSEKAKYITVIRDPKEVVVSSYYFLGGIMGVLDHLTVSDWFELFMRDGAMADAWAVHTASFWDVRHRPNVLVLTYGELKREPRRFIEQAATLMGVALDPTEVDTVVERASFDYMSAHESQFAPPQSPFGSRSETRMVRSGKTGASEELLSAEQQAAIDERCQQALRALGSDFPYAEAFDVVRDPADAASP